MGAFCDALPVEVHAFCVLPGHYHLLARADFRVLRIMLAAAERVARRTGPGPARMVPVTFGRHLTAVSRYIHLNPVEAGLAAHPEHWPHSSLGAYLGDRTAPRWVATEAILGRFGSIGARHRYRAYVDAGLDPGTRDRDGRPKPAISRDHDWRIEPVLVPSRPRPDGPPPLTALARTVAGAHALPAASLRSARAGGSTAARARGAFVLAARASGGHRLRDLAAFLGYASAEAAAAAAERHARAATAS